MNEPLTPSGSSSSSRLSAGRIGWISTAVLSHVALASASVETFRSQSSVRWWVVGIVAAYLGGLLAVWRWVPSAWKRLTPSTLAISGAGLFLALLAATAWLPGGNTDGIRVFGQSTSTLLTAVSALAVALSGVSLARLQFLPRGVRYALGALAAYGVASFGLSIVSATPYAALLQGGSFWIRLPRWLQGASVGGFVVLPAGILGGLASLVVRSPAPGTGGTLRLQHLALLGLGLVIAASGVRVPALGGSPQLGQASQAGAMEIALPTVQIKDMGALVDQVVAEAGELPRAEFDPAALVDALDRDPQKLFEWVRDRTWWAPYRGLLRGAKGVMLDRVGSSLDRAVLLGELMRRAGHTVRLAHAQLPEDRARELLGKVRPIPDQRRAPTTPKAASADQQRAAEAIMPGLQKAMKELVADSKRRSDQAAALVRSQADQLSAAVRDVATKAGADDDKAAVAALQDHWWAEREDNGNWIALDVLLADAKVGVALAAASETSEWKAGADAPSIPATDWHTVRIRVVVERYQGGATTESTVLETNLRPMDVLERPVTLGHMPKPWPAEVPGPKTDPKALRDAALTVREWVPFLSVGRDLIAQSGFTDSGDVKTNPLDPVANTGGGGLFGGMESALGGGDAGEGFATAEWIDYEIRVPGGPSQRLRRPVFDLLGPARRATRAAGFEANTDALKLERFEALWSRTDILLQPCDFTGEFVAHLMSASIVANQMAIRELSQERDSAKARNQASAILGHIDIWGALPDLVLWRSALSRQPGDSFIDRPNVLNYRISRPVVDADRATLREMIDIASNATGVRRGASRNSFEVRLQQGVTDTVAEMLTLGNDFRSAENTASVFAMTPSILDRGILIEPRDTAAVRKLGWSADAAARLAENVDAGFAAVALKEPVLVRERQHVGWWRVDPASGETIGVMDTGFHAGMSEDALTRLKVGLMEFLDENWVAWAQLQVRSAGMKTIGASVARDLAIRATAIELLDLLNRLG
jgi:hypothetical protein